jgi:putative nucleotidyltransferase with HDIG domain
MKEKIPTYSECLHIIDKKGMLENIKAHSILVMKVSLAITDALKPGVNINRELVLAGAILHDITKTESLATHEPHDLSGGAYLRSLGLHRIAEIVEAHVEAESLDFDGPLSEEDIVHYADKRVKHASIVSLSQRIEDLLVRYGDTEERRKMILQRVPYNEKLEDKIAAHCIKPLDEIVQQVS